MGVCGNNCYVTAVVEDGVFFCFFLFFYMGIYIHEIDTSLLKLTLLMRRKINIHYKE